MIRTAAPNPECIITSSHHSCCCTVVEIGMCWCPTLLGNGRNMWRQWAWGERCHSVRLTVGVSLFDPRWSKDWRDAVFNSPEGSRHRNRSSAIRVSISRRLSSYPSCTALTNWESIVSRPVWLHHHKLLLVSGLPGERQPPPSKMSWSGPIRRAGVSAQCRGSEPGGVKPTKRSFVDRWLAHLLCDSTERPWFLWTEWVGVWADPFAVVLPEARHVAQRIDAAASKTSSNAGCFQMPCTAWLFPQRRALKDEMCDVTISIIQLKWWN